MDINAMRVWVKVWLFLSMANMGFGVLTDGWSLAEKVAFDRGWAFFCGHPQLPLTSPVFSEADKALLGSLPTVFGPRELTEILREQRHKHLLFLETANVVSEDLETLLKEIEKFLWHPIFALKMKWNRSRPIDLLPIPCVGQRPRYGSYPSGAALEAYVLANVLSRLYPSAQDRLFRLAERVGQHRVKCGFNFPSDVEYAVTLSFPLSEEVCRIFSDDLTRVAEKAHACMPRPAQLPTDTVVFQAKPLKDVAKELQRVSGKVILCECTKPILVNEKFSVSDWRLMLDLLAFEKNLQILETAKEIQIFEKQ